MPCACNNSVLLDSIRKLYHRKEDTCVEEITHYIRFTFPYRLMTKYSCLLGILLIAIYYTKTSLPSLSLPTYQLTIACLGGYNTRKRKIILDFLPMLLLVV